MQKLQTLSKGVVKRQVCGPGWFGRYVLKEYVHALLDKETSVRRIATICCKIQIRVKLSKTDLNILGDRCGVQMYGVGE